LGRHDVGADDTIDSDGISTNYNGLDVAITTIMSISDTEYDYTTDLGIFQTNLGAVGNYVWADINNDGIQNESATNGINGVTVNIYDNNNPGTIYATDITSNDINGNPGYYLFDLLPAGNYFLEFIKYYVSTIKFV